MSSERWKWDSVGRNSGSTCDNVKPVMRRATPPASGSADGSADWSTASGSVAWRQIDIKVSEFAVHMIVACLRRWRVHGASE